MRKMVACTTLAIAAGVISGIGVEQMYNSQIQTLEAEYDDAVENSEVVRNQLTQTYGNLEKFGELIGPYCLSALETSSDMRNDGTLTADEAVDVLVAQVGQPCGEDKAEISNHITMLGLHQKAFAGSQANFAESIETTDRISRELFKSRANKVDSRFHAFYLPFLGTVFLSMSFVAIKDHYTKIAERENEQIIEFQPVD